MLQDLDDGGEELPDAVAALGVEVGGSLALAETGQVVVDCWVVHPTTLRRRGLRLTFGYPLKQEKIISLETGLLTFQYFSLGFLGEAKQHYDQLLLSRPPTPSISTGVWLFSPEGKPPLTWKMVGTMEL